MRKNKHGQFIQVERNISTAREVLSLAISNFHRQMIRQAGDALDKTPAAKRDVSSLTVALSQKKFEEAKRRIQEFRRELNVFLSEEENPAAVYQINFQIFNLSEVPW